MIKIIQNPNLKEWFQVFQLGELIDEMRSQSLAMRKAQRYARKHGYKNFSIQSNGEEEIFCTKTLTIYKS